MSGEVTRDEYNMGQQRVYQKIEEYQKETTAHMTEMEKSSIVISTTAKIMSDMAKDLHEVVHGTSANPGLKEKQARDADRVKLLSKITWSALVFIFGLAGYIIKMDLVK